MNVRSEILKFLRAPQEFASTLSRNDAPIWRQGLEEFAQPQIAKNARRRLLKRPPALLMASPECLAKGDNFPQRRLAMP
jgi:hypothetical protein